MSQPMALHVPTALRTTYEHLTTVSATVARRYLEVATVLQHTLTGAALAPNCPTWATTTSGAILLPR